MAEYTLKIRRFLPESGEPAYWQQYTVDLEPHLSVLEAILQVRNGQTGPWASAAPAGRRSAAPAACASTASPAWRATPTSTRR